MAQGSLDLGPSFGPPPSEPDFGKPLSKTLVDRKPKTWRLPYASKAPKWSVCKKVGSCGLASVDENSRTIIAKTTSTKAAVERMESILESFEWEQ